MAQRPLSTFVTLSMVVVMATIGGAVEASPTPVGRAANPTSAAPRMAKNVNSARSVDFETVVPKDDPMATAIVVKGKTRLYLFPPGSEVTRTESHLIIRGYTGIFAYAASDVKARRLGEKALLDLSRLAEDRDAELRRTLNDARTDLPRPADDLCPDCVVPVVSAPKR
ncbi:MAG: hypothetical protein JO199_05695 [Candidatus Eremiobacteraeota bacterium]|nr:hypothetical protein [Candidatus Eremiobacteraeota bacterium]